MSVTSDQPVNWEVTQGESFPIELQYQDPDGNPIDISGIDVIMKVVDKPGGAVVCATLSTNNGITVSNPASGIMEIDISPAQTMKFNYPRSYYEVLGTDQYGEKILFLQGWFTVAVGLI